MKFDILKRGGYNIGSISVIGGETSFPITLSRNPILPNEAATKAYLDGKLNNLSTGLFNSGIISVLNLPAFTGDIIKAEGSGSTAIKASGVFPGNYPKVTVNTKGQVVSGLSLAEVDVPNLPWTKINSNLPNTLTGYGITDALPLTGGIMTGQLKVGTVGESPKSLINKQYVDQEPGTGNSGYKTGDIVHKLTSITPEGFLKANGGEVSKTTYADLYAVIGDSPLLDLGSLYVGNGKPWCRQYDINTTFQDNITDWQKDLNLPDRIAGSQVIKTTNRVYLLGGDNGSGNLSEIYTTIINENGELGGWEPAGYMLEPLSYFQAVVTINRVYVLGGESDEGKSYAVYTAPINPDGTLGAWDIGFDLPTAVAYAQVVKTSSRVYLLGGEGNEGQLSNVYYATINPDGTLNEWVEDVGLNGILANFNTIVTNNRVYLIGGYGAYGRSSSVFTAAIDEEGIIGTWYSDVDLPVEISDSQTVVINDRVYLIGGNTVEGDELYTSKIFVATINQDGTLGAWTLYGNLPKPLAEHCVVKTDTNVYVIGGTDPDDFSSDVYCAPINQDNTLRDWLIKNTLPIGLSYTQAIVTKNRVYLLGGTFEDGWLSSTYTASINENGTLGPWSLGADLPTSLTASQAIVTKNRVYLLGGETDYGITANTYTAKINSDGTLGTWVSGTPLPSTMGFSQAVIAKNKVFLLGGYNEDYYSSKIFSAPIDSDGIIGTWSIEGYLPVEVSDAQAFVIKDRLFLLGGETNTEEVYLDVSYSAVINEDGTLGTWSIATTLPESIAYSHSLVTKNKIYLFGGSGDRDLSICYSAVINPDGTIGTWEESSDLPTVLERSQLIATKGKVYLLGGGTGDVGQSKVMYSADLFGSYNDYSPYFASAVTPLGLGSSTSNGTVPGAGQPWRQQYDINDTQIGDISDWEISGNLPIPNTTSQAIVTNYRVYLFGGYHDSAVSSAVYTAPINTDGSLGAWTRADDLPEPFERLQAVVAKNRVYLIGGNYDAQYPTNVYSSVINEDGIIGEWVGLNSLPRSLSMSQAIVTKGRIYVLGGIDDGLPKHVIYSAVINEDGTLGTWSNVASLLDTLHSSQAVVTKNKVYLLGGFGSSYGEASAIYKCNINEDGTLGTWTAAGNLPESLGNSQAIVTNSRVYLFGGTDGDNTLDTTYSAPIDEEGNIGTWTTGPSLVDPLRSSQVIITKNKVHLLGGNGFPASSKIYTATIQGGLNDYSAYYGDFVPEQEPAVERTTFTVPNIPSKLLGATVYIKY